MENPDDLESWAVLGDLLQSAGELQGEMITLDLHLRNQPEDQACKDRREFLLRSIRTNHSELREIYAFEGEDNLYGPNQILDWEFGFIRTARIHGPYSLNNGSAQDVLRIILNSKAARFLRTLELSTAPPDQIREGELRESIRILVERGTLKNIRELTLGRASEFPDREPLRGAILGPLDELLRTVPGLHFISLTGIDSHLEEFTLKQLREIRLYNKALGPEILRSMGRADLSFLEVLHFNLEHGNLSKALPVAGTGGPLGYYQLVILPETLRNFKLLFNNPTLLNLKGLHLQYCEWGGELLNLLKDLPLLGDKGSLRILDMINTGINDEQLDPLLEAPEQFQSLERLNLSQNNISEAAILQLKRVFGEQIILENQWIPRHLAYD